MLAPSTGYQRKQLLKESHLTPSQKATGDCDKSLPNLENRIRSPSDEGPRRFHSVLMANHHLPHLVTIINLSNSLFKLHSTLPLKNDTNITIGGDHCGTAICWSRDLWKTKDHISGLILPGYTFCCTKA